MAPVLVAAGLIVTGCGDDEKDSAATTTAATTTTAAAPAEYAPSRTTCSSTPTRLKTETATLREDAEAYYALAEAARTSTTPSCSPTSRAEVSELVERAAAGLRRANPAYEQMEGVVAGVP